jgi:hypothetical protein
MSDMHFDSDADSISDSSNAHVDVRGDEALISSAVRELCDQLRANDPHVVDEGNIFEPSHYKSHYSEAECMALFQALKENSSVKRIVFSMLFDYAKRYALVAAEYVESSKTLQALELGCWRYQYSREVCEMILLSSALSVAIRP